MLKYLLSGLQSTLLALRIFERRAGFLMVWSKYLYSYQLSPPVAYSPGEGKDEKSSSTSFPCKVLAADTKDK